jgi:hypothetical protein
MSLQVTSLLIGWSLNRAAWMAICAVVAVSVALLVALWKTRLRRAETWKKCAILSLWIHAVLAFLATTIHLFSGGGAGLGEDLGPGPPIRVALTDDSAEDEPAPIVQEMLAPSTVVAEATEEDVDDAPAETIEPDPAEVVETMPPPVAVEAAPPVAAESFEAPDLIVAAPASEEQTAVPKEQSNAVQPGAAASAAREDSPPGGDERVASQSAPPAAYAERFAENRAQIVAGRGGDENTEKAVRAALAWLAAVQSGDGRWEPARYGAGQERYVLGQDRGGAGAKADTGVTGLALLALLGSGHTPRHGVHAGNVARGLRYLREAQRSDGNLAGDAELFARMYCHSMAMFALSEAAAITRDKELAPAVQAAVRYSLAVQHPTDGGWRYRPGDTGDTSQLGWQLMALKSAEAAGVAAPAVTWTRVERFLRQVERGPAGGLAAYRPEGPPTRTMTAEGLYCRQLLAEKLGTSVTTAATAEAIESLLAEPPSPDLVNLYYWYYGTLALHHGQFASVEGAAAWQRWNRSLVKTLLSTQRPDGSWPETCLWGGYGGRVYTTALATMCLEVYYRYAPGEPQSLAQGESRGSSAWSPVGPDDATARKGWQSIPSK